MLFETGTLLIVIFYAPKPTLVLGKSNTTRSTAQRASVLDSAPVELIDKTIPYAT